ncbi:MAG: ATP synthase F0 subunit A [Candidatus Wildermuthbacteria bacterium RIFCSPHIGHO2_01_FULL_45_20]|uniref:ATP synthase subunit a n=1 Tax=Candidatus Wildermuthbacteria bacterium RIFCSPHIGHO2_02_FULL_45_25 TaxID=1802450 RepID=A0A1G2R057_9BACT|nr:MAG: ATP synthase F0 subunit A [Candidatus Wildermuthbacteria bacterium RIFCSPHIGHO2_01_FULL_45_20]OHA65652.1 MAG: ATP synthase F0 subunit A [Candidatus Wildermuthbacteria bacterium RIFCSPHIGHO2_02_FULL_45_25]
MVHISLQPEILGHILGFPITNSFILSLLTAIILIGVGVFVAKSLRFIPNRLQNIVELIIEGLLGFMTQVLGDAKLARKFFPLIATIFLFILVNNWIGVLPGTGSIGFYENENAHVLESPEGTDAHEEIEPQPLEEKEESHGQFVPFFRAANSDLNTTLALAFVAMGAIQMYGIAKLGFFAHIGKFIILTKGPIYFFVGLLELIGEFAKIFSFSFRLFGNIFAGEVLLVIIMTLVPVIIPIPFLFLEFFVGFIQALVFSMLTLIFLKVATTEVEH